MDAVACGLGCFRATWMNKCATVKSFMTIYSLLGTIQAMSYVYFTLTLTTLEKRFKIPGKTLGVVLSGNEVSQILLSLILSYYGGHHNRPKWIAWGTLFSALSCFILALPHFMYGPGQDALDLTYQYIDLEKTSLDSLMKVIAKPVTTCMANKNATICGDRVLTGDFSRTPLVLIFLSQFMLGIGTTLYYVLGQTYIDDNTKKKNSPKLLAVSMALRMFGPALGFVLGFICLRLYIDPTLDPVITLDDPRWMGAWWLGWIFLGTVMTFFAFLIAMFPKNIPKKKSPILSAESERRPLAESNTLDKAAIPQFDLDVPEHPPTIKPNLKDFPVAIRRLLNNKILVYNIFSGVFYILGASGYMTYFAKYIEVQYQKSSATGSVVAGPMILMGTVVGLLGSGYIISTFKPKPRTLLFWNVIVGFGYMIGEFSLIFLDCPDYVLNSFANLPTIQTGLNLTENCNMHCDCSEISYAPVCFEKTHTTYFSPCHAGCVTQINNTKDYTNCGCLPSSNNFVQTFSNYNVTPAIENMVKNGFCEANCQTGFWGFVFISGLINFLGSSGKIGNLLVNYRAVDVKDKAFAQGMALWILSVFALIPGPIIYGYIYDDSCLIWDRSCGKQGNCWFFNRNRLRWTLNSTALALTAIGVGFDIVVWRLGWNLDLYSEPDEIIEEEINVKK